MKIHYSNPFSIDKKFGKAINEFCELIRNPEDWIVIQDGDIIYLNTNWGEIIHNNLLEHGDQWQLLGALTNRISLEDSLLNKEFSEDFDIRNHLEKAKKNDLKGIKETFIVAGYFMAFQKKTWEKVGGFIEDQPNFDVNFSLKIRESGGKIGIMNEMYVFHLYRPWSIYPRFDINHLL